MRISILSKPSPFAAATVAAVLFGCQAFASPAVEERDNLIRNLAQMWSQQADESFDTMANLFAPLEDARLQAIGAATSIDQVRRILGGESTDTAAAFSLAAQGIGTLSLGEEDKDLVYTPVTPCRIVDTRSSTAGNIPGGVIRGFKVYGSGGDMTPQGGSTEGCPSPRGEPRAVHINVAHLSSINSGFLTVFPANLAIPPLAAWTNPQDPPKPISNIGTVQTGFMVGDDIKVFASNTSDVVIDVLGYYHEAAAIETHYHQTSRLNTTSVNAGTSYVKIDDYLTFNKVRAGTRIEVHLNSRADSGAFGAGVHGVRYQVRIDGVQPRTGGIAAITDTDTIDFVSIYAVFEGLAKGSHTLSVWAKAVPSGTSNGVMLDPGGFGGTIIVKETL